MNNWKIKVRLSGSGIRISVTSPEDIILNACFPHPGHPNALLTLLEGLALWQESIITAVVSVDPSCHLLLDEDSLGALWKKGSWMVRYQFIPGR